MRFQFALPAICGLVLFAAGCNGTAAPQIAVEPAEKPKETELKEFDGNWALKSSAISAEQGIYPVKANEGMVVRIKDGIAETRKGNGSWTKYGTFSLGTEPNCLQVLKSDASGQQRLMKLRYKLEGTTLTTVQDNQFPDVLPDSFEMKFASERHRQTNIYVKSDH